MKRFIYVLLLFFMGCAPLKKGILKSPTLKSHNNIDRFFNNITERNSQFKGIKGSGRIVLEEGKYQWSAIFKLYVTARDSAKISIYGPLGMKVFTIFVNGKDITFDRKTDYGAIADLFKSTDLIGETFSSILSSLPLIDTQTVRIDSSSAIVLKYSNLDWFYNIHRAFPDSLHIYDDKHLTAIIKYSDFDNLYGPFSTDIYSAVFDAHLKIHFNKKVPLI